MSYNFIERVKNFLLDEDYAINSLEGGKPRESISGTVGRAAASGKLWAVYLAQPLVNFIMRSKTHCQDTMKTEELRREKLGPND